MFGLGMTEMVVIGVIAVLLFGKRLPEVAKSVGKSYQEFRKGLGDIQSQVHDTVNTYDPYASTPVDTAYSPNSSSDDYDDYDEATAPKFEPPASEPEAEESASQES